MTTLEVLQKKVEEAESEFAEELSFACAVRPSLSEARAKLSRAKRELDRATSSFQRQEAEDETYFD